jgi:Sigma-70 region 2
MPAHPAARRCLPNALTVGMKMKEMAHGAERLRQVVGPSPDIFLRDAVHKPSNDPSAAATLLRPRDLLTAEQERVMAEHLPMMRLVARRIHGRLPQHVPIEDLYSAGVIGLLDAFGRFDP